MYKVTFQFEVTVDEVLLPETYTDEDIADTAYDIVATAPAFDGVDPEELEDLTVAKVEQSE